MSASPDALNTNAALRGYVATGFRQAFPDSPVESVPFEAGLAALRRFQPELLLLFGSVILDRCDYTDLFGAASEMGVKVAAWVHDDPYEFDMNYRVADRVDALFTNDRNTLLHYAPGLPVHHLPMAGCSLHHERTPRSGVPGSVFFCGHAFDCRQEFLASLSERLPDEAFEIRGTGWDPARVPAAQNRRIPNTTLPDRYAEAAVVLNLGRDHSYANRRFAMRPSTPGPRTFEAALAGALQIYCGGPEIEDYFVPDREILLCSDSDEAADLIRAVRRDPDRGRAIGEAARARALADHTYAVRAKRIVDCTFG